MGPDSTSGEGCGRDGGEADAAERIGLVEADVVALARPGAGLVGQRARRRRGRPAGSTARPGPGRGAPGPRPGRPCGTGAAGRSAAPRWPRPPGPRRPRCRPRRLPGSHRRARHGRSPAGPSRPRSRAWRRRGPGRPAAGRIGPRAARRAQRRGVLEQPRRHDRRQPAAIGQTVQGRVQVRLQVLEGRVGEHSVEPARRRGGCRAGGARPAGCGSRGGRGLRAVPHGRRRAR